MSTCVNYCTADPIGAYEILSCSNDPVGGLSAVILLECGHSITEADASDPADFAAAIDANILSGNATLVARCSLTIDAASPVTVDSLVPCETPSLVTYDRKGVYKNPNVTPDNIEFHELFQKRIQSFNDSKVNLFGVQKQIQCVTLHQLVFSVNNLN